MLAHTQGLLWAPISVSGEPWFIRTPSYSTCLTGKALCPFNLKCSHAWSQKSCTKGLLQKNAQVEYVLKAKTHETVVCQLKEAKAGIKPFHERKSFSSKQADPALFLVL
jgi:hypothetical protein